MTTWHLLLGIVVAICLWFGWWLAHRRPWDGKLHGWRLDPAVGRAKRRYYYWPLPDHIQRGWKRPYLVTGTHHSYCLRCGKWPFQGRPIMCSKDQGFMCICYPCGMKTVTTFGELKRYAHMVIDLKICQNFDPHITHPDHAEPITHFMHMWDAAQKDLEKMEAER